jgi:arylsulfatase A-like enzyme
MESSQPSSHPNIILIMTDQQRYDTIRYVGAEQMITPNLDRLAREGVCYDNAFVTAPSCVPSRASFFNGRYPLSMGVSKNGSKWETSWVERLQEAGYHTVNIGKMHTNPHTVPCGFDQRFIVENKDRPGGAKPHGKFYDEWDKFLANSEVEKPSRYKYKAEYPGYENALGAFEWPLEEKYHSDAFIGRMAKWFIEQRNSPSPLFLQIGFPGPHPPYDPPQRWIDAYEGVEFPLPSVTQEELDKQPPAHAVARNVMIHDNFDAVCWKENPAPEELQRLKRYYAANVSLIDEQVGMILDTLDRHGYLENAVVVFMSDHGDSIGDHGHIQKWNMYDCVTRVPMIVWSPGRLPAGKRVDALIQHFDIAATLFDMIGLEAPADWDAISLWPQLDQGRECVFSEHGKDNVYKEVDQVWMIRDREYKLVQYDDEQYGELYDLRQDPEEKNNVWNDERYEAVRGRLLEAVASHGSR